MNICNTNAHQQRQDFYLTCGDVDHLLTPRWPELYDFDPPIPANEVPNLEDGLLNPGDVDFFQLGVFCGRSTIISRM